MKECSVCGAPNAEYLCNCVHYIAEQANELTKILEEKHVDA